MSNRFVIGTGRTTAEEDAAFKTNLGSKFPGSLWWHWIGETWLIVDNANQLNESALRDLAMEAFPGRYLLVLIFSSNGSDNWAGFGPVMNDDPKNMFRWIEQNWKRK